MALGAWVMSDSPLLLEPARACSRSPSGAEEEPPASWVGGGVGSSARIVGDEGCGEEQRKEKRERWPRERRDRTRGGQ